MSVSSEISLMRKALMQSVRHREREQERKVSVEEVLADLVDDCLMSNDKEPHHANGITITKLFEELDRKHL